MPDAVVVEKPVVVPPEQEFLKANPEDNPRAQAMKEIAARRATEAAAEAGETMPSIDDEGNVTPAPAAAVGDEASQRELGSEPAEHSAEEEPKAPAEPPVSAPAGTPASIDPNAEYELVVEGQKIKVLGSKIFDSGVRTLQKETAADLKLNLASQLLNEALERSKALPVKDGPDAPGKPKEAAEPADDLALAKAIQFGTEEQAADAIKRLRASGKATSTEDVLGFVQAQVPKMVRGAVGDELAFQGAMSFVQSEYKDLLDKPKMRSLFFLEEKRLREGGDRRPYAEVYKSIGEDLRKEFNMSKPQSVVDATSRREAKASAPSVPRTATARVADTGGTLKPKTASEVIAQMAKARGQGSLNMRKG